MENDNESRDVFGDSRKRYRCPQAEIGKYGPRKEAIRLQDSSLCPLEKKIQFKRSYPCWHQYGKRKKYSSTLRKNNFPHFDAFPNAPYSTTEHKIFRLSNKKLLKVFHYFDLAKQSIFYFPQKLNHSMPVSNHR